MALPHLEMTRGTLINIGGRASAADLPQGMFAASKAAVKGFTDELRAELERERVPVTVRLIEPRATDTPFPQHARNYMGRIPTTEVPLADPFNVAEVILEASTQEKRSVRISNTAKMSVLMSMFAPVADTGASRQEHDQWPRNPDGALHRRSDSGRIFGEGWPRVEA